MRDINDGKIPEATVIIPAYNVEKYIYKCINSIIRTTHSAVELIVVDDGSTDKTGKIIDELSHRDCRIRTIHTENKGVSCARNLALDQSRGKYLFFVDADDYVDDCYIDKLIDKFKVTGCDALLISAVLERSDRMERQQKIEPKTIEKIKSGANPVYAGYPLYLWNFAFSKDAIGPTRFNIHLRISEDADFISRVCSRVHRFALSEAPRYHYFVARPESALTKIDLYGCLDIKHIKAELIRRAKKSDDISRVVDEYGAASFGVLRRCANNMDIYDRERQIPEDLIALIRQSKRVKSRLCTAAQKHRYPLRLLFLLASFFSRKLNIK